MGERGTGPKSLVERTKGYREIGRCSAMCSRFDASGFDLMPLGGVPCFPFYRPRESTGYSRRKEENEREIVLQGRRAFPFLCAGPTDTIGADRDSSTPGALSTDDAMP